METLSRQTVERKMRDCDALQDVRTLELSPVLGCAAWRCRCFELPLLFVSNPSPLLLFRTSIKMHWFPYLDTGAVVTVVCCSLSV